MTRLITKSILLLAAVSLLACTDSVDPLSPGTKDGNYSIGLKALVPIVIGNRWTYQSVIFDTTGSELQQARFTLTVVDTALADTALIPLPTSVKLSVKREAFLWYVFRSEGGATTYWQIDTVENLRIRSEDDARFLEQIPFNFRAAVHDTTAARFTSRDINPWGISDALGSNDSVRTALVSKGRDSLRTTLGSSEYFHYRQLYARHPFFTDYYFKPGFGLVMIERYLQKADTAICVRRDQLVSYYFH